MKSEAVLALDRGDAVEAGDGGGREDGERDGVLQPVLVADRPALVLPLVRQAAVNRHYFNFFPEESWWNWGSFIFIKESKSYLSSCLEAILLNLKLISVAFILFIKIVKTLNSSTSDL